MVKVSLPGFSREGSALSIHYCTVYNVRTMYKVHFVSLLTPTVIMSYSGTFPRIKVSTY
jgi:hypothetical protein